MNGDFRMQIVKDGREYVATITDADRSFTGSPKPTPSEAAADVVRMAISIVRKQRGWDGVPMFERAS